MQATDGFTVTAHFDESHAAKYDRRIRQFCPGYDALHDLAAVWCAALPPDTRFLSSGAGTGAEILVLGRRFPAWNFVAVDVSADMIQACRDKTASTGMAGRVDFFTGRLQDYPASAPFGAASSIFVAHFIKESSEKRSYFKSIAANLQIGGVFILADLFGDKQSSSFAPLLDAWLRHYASHGVDADTLARDRAHVERDIDYRPESELTALLVEAGFAPPVRFFQSLLFGGWATVRVA